MRAYHFRIYINFHYALIFYRSSSLLDLSVSCGSGNIAVNSGIAQSFYPTRSGVIDRIAIWIEPTTSYRQDTYTVQVFEGEPGSILLGESPTVTTAGGGPDQFYDFRFLSPITLNEGNQYSWKLVPQSGSGAFNMYSDTIPGNGYWLADLRYPERDGMDHPFKLYILA